MQKPTNEKGRYIKTENPKTERIRLTLEEKELVLDFRVSKKKELVSFYRFVREVQKIIEKDEMFRKRYYFDLLYPKLVERMNIELDQFHSYMKDLNMIFTTKIVLNPAVPGRKIKEKYLLPLGSRQGRSDSLVMLEKCLN